MVSRTDEEEQGNHPQPDQKEVPSNGITFERKMTSPPFRRPKRPQRESITTIKKAYLLKTLEAIAAIVTYCLSAIFTTILNRHVLSDMKFGMNALLLIFQWIISIVLLLSLRCIGLIHFRLLRRDECLRWLPVSLGLVGMTYTGSKCLEHCTISIVTIFKNTSILLVAFGDLFFFNKKISLLTYFSFVLIILSSFLGTFGDPKFTIIGMIWLMINCFATAMYVLFLKGTLRTIKFKDFDTVFNNSIVSIPIMLVISVFSDAWGKFLYYETNPIINGGPHLILSIFGCAFCIFMTAIGTAWVVRITSPTTYSMTAALNKLPMSLGGILFLESERSVSLMNIVGIVVGFISGVVYSISMIRQSKSNLRKKQREAAVSIKSTDPSIGPSETDDPTEILENPSTSSSPSENEPSPTTVLSLQRLKV